MVTPARRRSTVLHRRGHSKSRQLPLLYAVCSLSLNTRRTRRPVSLISSFSCSLIGLLCHEVFASQSALGKEEVISESTLRSLSSFAAPGIVCCGDWQCLFFSS
ncbi:uncharacterized protein K444DRAFT_136320 [Hyaloscypha bicolor E]|uniref:Uncharacterized protein n=1 Tax=Hyaloscypha bicolor E TaxID=1095630 RepID=A0A2J6STQ6_9HELO|nr:uncharacterized protein K444DRAFT_136320 [Hyaloscypha bicolor E]PMD54139.1 hypothetical protein K444DRAFT_136320 [Hyaloscypha bicolor E]